MKKIISLFVRDFEHNPRYVLRTVTPGGEWVIAGEGLATRKHDGTACMVRGGELYRRYDAKHGKRPPFNFEAAQDPDPATGHWPGWVPVTDDPGAKWHRAAYAAITDAGGVLPDGTYELCGPHFQSNPEGLDADIFIPHGSCALHDAPRDFDGIKEYLAAHAMEGIVWHHPDGRMVKIKAGDFGIEWPRKKAVVAV